MPKTTATPEPSLSLNRFQRIEAVIRLIPEGRVSSYGDIAAFTTGVSPRHVGFALAGSKEKLPWHRVVNAQGSVSSRGSDAMNRQRHLLEAEGVTFNAKDEIDWRVFGWSGPELDWFLDQGREVEESISILSKISARHEKQSKKHKP